MSTSETSLLIEEVKAELLSGDGTFTLQILDTDSNKTILEREVEIENPFDFDLSRFLPNQKIMDLPRFLEVSAELIDALQDAEGIPEDKRVKLVSDFQPERFSDFGGDVITYKLRKRIPANMNASATGRPQRRATHGYDLRSPNNPNKVIVVESRPIDHEIVFSCWSKNIEHADRLALWLENNLIKYTWAYQVQGVERFFWKGREADTYWTTSGVRLHQRPLIFFVRLREFQNRAYPILRNMDFEVTIDN